MATRHRMWAGLLALSLAPLALLYAPSLSTALPPLASAGVARAGSASASLISSADASLRSWRPTTSLGAEQTLEASDGEIDTPSGEFSLIRFNLADLLPPGAIIDSALSYSAGRSTQIVDPMMPWFMKPYIEHVLPVGEVAFYLLPNPVLPFSTTIGTESSWGKILQALADLQKKSTGVPADAHWYAMVPFYLPQGNIAGYGSLPGTLASGRAPVSYENLEDGGTSWSTSSAITSGGCTRRAGRTAPTRATPMPTRCSAITAGIHRAPWAGRFSPSRRATSCRQAPSTS